MKKKVRQRRFEWIIQYILLKSTDECVISCVRTEKNTSAPREEQIKEDEEKCTRIFFYKKADTFITVRLKTYSNKTENIITSPK